MTVNHRQSVSAQPVMWTLPDNNIPHYSMSISNSSMGLRLMDVFHGGVVVVLDTNGNAAVDTDVRTNGGVKPYFVSTWYIAMDYEKTAGLAQIRIMQTFKNVEASSSWVYSGYLSTDDLAIVNSLYLNIAIVRHLHARHRLWLSNQLHLYQTRFHLWGCLSYSPDGSAVSRYSSPVLYPGPLRHIQHMLLFNFFFL